MLRKIIILILIIFTTLNLDAQVNKSTIKLARVKYSGGGDWYNDPSSEVELLKFVKTNTNINVDPVYEYVDIATDNLFQYPLIFLTGHGDINFTDTEVQKLKSYLENGGFLYIDDDYGLDKYIRIEMKKVFPDQEFAELPFSHGLFSAHFKFQNGVPKTHEHDNKKPQTYGLFHNKRLCVVYTFESNPSDGWAEPTIHNDTPEARLASLQFGCNMIVWALNN